MFDLNDFDETPPGPFEWDVKRLATSLEIAARSNSFKTKEARIVVAAVRSYRQSMRVFAEMPKLAVWYARVDADEVLSRLRATAPIERAARPKLDRTAKTKDSLRR